MKSSKQEMVFASRTKSNDKFDLKSMTDPGFSVVDVDSLRGGRLISANFSEKIHENEKILVLWSILWRSLGIP